MKAFGKTCGMRSTCGGLTLFFRHFWATSIRLDCLQEFLFFYFCRLLSVKEIGPTVSILVDKKLFAPNSQILIQKLHSKNSLYTNKE